MKLMGNGTIWMYHLKNSQYCQLRDDFWDTFQNHLRVVEMILEGVPKIIPKLTALAETAEDY